MNTSEPARAEDRPDVDGEPVAGEPAEPEADEAPLNRAARRAKDAKKATPSHVGPQDVIAARRGRGPRSSSRRAR